MSSGFAGEVPGVEFLEGGVDVVDVEYHHRPDPLVGIDLEDAKYLREEPLGLQEPVTTQGEPLAAGRYHGRCCFLYAEVGDRAHACDLGIPTASQAGVHHATTIVY